MIRMPLLFTLALIVTGTALAVQEPVPPSQAAPLTLNRLLTRAPEASTGVIEARNDLSAAQRELAILEADPQALPIDLAALRREVEARQDDLEVAELQSRVEAFNLYTALLEADLSLEQARMSAEIAETSLQATQARFEAGAATRLEVSGAENELASARRSLGEARTDRQFALQSLEAFLGAEVDALEPVTDEDLLAVPDEEEAFARLDERNTRIQGAARAVEDARDQLAAVDNDFTAPREVQAARETVESAEETLQETREAVRLSLRQSLAGLTAARNRYENALEAHENALESHRAQEARFEAGTVSRIALAESELSWLGSRASLQSALHAHLLAQLQLEVALVE